MSHRQQGHLLDHLLVPMLFCKWMLLVSLIARALQITQANHLVAPPPPPPPPLPLPLSPIPQGVLVMASKSGVQVGGFLNLGGSLVASILPALTGLQLAC